MRVFEFGDLIPDEVERLVGPDGGEYVRAENGLFRWGEDPDDQVGYLSARTDRQGPKPQLSCWFDWEFPLMEVAV